jgi:hypothetical protein
LVSNTTAAVKKSPQFSRQCFSGFRIASRDPIRQAQRESSIRLKEIYTTASSFSDGSGGEHHIFDGSGKNVEREIPFSSAQASLPAARHIVTHLAFLNSSTECVATRGF